MLMKLFRSIEKSTSASIVEKLFSLYPPYLGAGVKVEKISSDYRYMKVALKLRFYNRNYVGTQFGGSIYSMTDPHYMFLLIKNLGPEYVVWDKGAKIEFIKPGKTHLIAEFILDEQIINTVKEMTKDGDKYIFDLPVTVRDLDGEVVAQLEKTLYVRKKRAP